MLKHLLGVAAVTTTLLGCANNPFSSYKHTSDKTLRQVATGNLTPLLADQESSTDVLYNMEHGSLARMNVDYQQSNRDFSLAQQVIDIWTSNWLNTTQGQISTTAVSYLLNDNANAYNPPGYEKTFLPTFHALNHLDLNNWDNARVEITKMYQIEQATENYNQALYAKEAADAQKNSTDKSSNYINKQILQKYDFSDINSPQVLALKNGYQNAFSHYLAGFVFEALNEPSLARPGYVKAGQLSPTTSLIQQSIDNLDKGVRPLSGSTDLLVVEETGHAPQILSVEAHIPINSNMVGTGNGCINMINVFFPKLMPDNRTAADYPLSIDANSYLPVLLVDVNLMAARALKDEVPHIIARNVAAAIRNIASSQAACTAGGNLGTLLSLGTSIGGFMLDRADERSWTLLPAKVNVTRLTLPYGKHTISVMVDGIPHQEQIILNQPYQVFALRVIDGQVFFAPQQSMLTGQH